jgi:NitT/TauT family transport system substrate-binding protein
MQRISSALSRGSFLTASLAAVTAPALAANPTPTPANLRVGGTPDADIIATIYAQKSGIFQKYGLTVDVQRLNSGSAVSAAVVGGALDIGKSSIFALIAGHVRGVPFVIESEGALYTSDDPDVGFIVAKDSPIATGRDFTGKIVTSPALGDLFSSVAAAWIDQNGGDSKTVKFIELPTNATAAAILAGRVDGAVMVDPILANAVSSGCRIIGHPFDTIAKRFGVTYYFTTRDFAAKNADVVARFRRGVAESTAYVLSHSREIAPLIADYTGVSLEIAQSKVQPIGAGVDLALLQPTIDFAAKYKIIPSAFSARDLVDPTALK